MNSWASRVVTNSIYVQNFTLLETVGDLVLKSAESLLTFRITFNIRDKVRNYFADEEKPLCDLWSSSSLSFGICLKASFWIPAFPSKSLLVMSSLFSAELRRRCRLFSVKIVFFNNWRDDRCNSLAVRVRQQVSQQVNAFSEWSASFSAESSCLCHWRYLSHYERSVELSLEIFCSKILQMTVG